MSSIAIAIYCFMKNQFFDISIKHLIKQFSIIFIILFIFFSISLSESKIISINNPAISKIASLIALNGIARAIGQASYSTYLCHIPVFSLVVGAGIIMTGSTSHETVIALTILAVILVLPASFLLYRFVEKPITAWGNHMIRKSVTTKIAQAAA